MSDWNLVQAVFDRDGLSPDEDVAVCTMHIRKTVQNMFDLVPVDDDARQSFANRFVDFWNQINGHFSTKITLRELRMYDVPSGPGIDMGDPVAIYGLEIPGTGTGGVMPPQCAISVTWRTEQRLRWGRFYLPGVLSTHLTASGRLDTISCDQIADAAHHLTSRSGTGGSLTVFSRKHWNHADPTTIQVDDIVDIIRRRRFSKPTYRAAIPAG